MILDNPQRRTLGSLGLPAIALLAGWSVFALGGANACPPEEGGKSTGQSEVVTSDQVIEFRADAGQAAVGVDVDVVKGEEGTFELRVNGSRIALPCPPDGGKDGEMIFMRKVGDGADCDLPGLVTEKDLATFREQNPTADADNDGKVSRSERSAYLAALALSNPTGVLAQFPAADRNKDGSLDAAEAARLVTDGNMDVEVIEGGPHTIAFAGAAAPAGGAYKVIRLQHEVQMKGEGQVTFEPGDMKPKVLKFSDDGTGGAPWWKMQTGADAAKWLLDNVTVKPVAADVAKLIPTVEEAPLARFLEMHPEADTNGDGKVSRDERSAFTEKEMTDIRARMLRRHPEADTDGDGVLSKDEEKAFFSKRTREVVTEGTTGANGELRYNVILKKDDGSTVEAAPAGAIEVKGEWVSEKPSSDTPK